MNDKTVIATRESRLALWQAEHVRDLLQSQFGREVELLGMTTKGDQILDRALSKVGGKGLFVKELETALEEGRAKTRVTPLSPTAMTTCQPCRRGLAWAPRACGAWCSCSASGPTCASSRCAAIWTPVFASSMRGALTPSCWPLRA